MPAARHSHLERARADVFKTLKNLLTGGNLTGSPPREGRETQAPSAAADRPDSGKQHWLAGRRLYDAGEFAAAARELERAIAVRHDFAEAHYLLGLAHRRLGAPDDAGDCLALAAHFRPEFAEAHFQLGVLAAERGRHGEAITSYSRAIDANGAYAEAYNARGAARLDAGDTNGAVEDFRRALELKPQFAPAHSNLGCVLITRLDRFEEGAAQIETALRLAPEDRDVLCNWAMLQQQRGRLAEALALCDRLLEENPGSESSRLNRGLVLLKQGDFARGWPDYEARKRTRAYDSRELPGAEWDGEPLSGRTILVYAEQGLGDQIMFASCIADLARLAARCVVECDPKLEPVFRRSFPEATVISTAVLAAGGRWPEQAPRIDCHVAIGSLPRHFRNSLAQFPAHGGYLHADPGRTAAWRRRLAGLPGGPKVGISWRGGMLTTRQSLRSVPLAEWLPIFGQAGAGFVSLQYTECRDELAQLERDHGIRVHHWQEAIDDYDETAALASALDLVISVQTSIVHLLGALGRPVWVMVPAVAEWRYLQSGTRMPWYPTVEVSRQEEPGKWAPVIEAVARRLAAWG